MAKRSRNDFEEHDPEPVAANGLLNRRVFLEAMAVAGGIGVTGAAAEPLAVPQWSKQPGAGPSEDSAVLAELARSWALPGPYLVPLAKSAAACWARWRQ